MDTPLIFLISLHPRTNPWRKNLSVEINDEDPVYELLLIRPCKLLALKNSDLAKTDWVISKILRLYYGKNYIYVYFFEGILLHHSENDGLKWNVSEQM